MLWQIYTAITVFKETVRVTISVGERAIYDPITTQSCLEIEAGAPGFR